MQNVSRQAATVLFSRGALLVFGLASNILLSRTLGPVGLGRYQLGFVLVQLVTSFCVLGLDKALMRYFPILEAKGGGGRRALLVQGTAIVILISIVFSAVLLFLAPVLADSYFHSADMRGVVRVFCLYLPIFSLARFFGGAVGAVKRVDIGAKITNVLTPALFLAGVAAVAVTNTGLYGAITARSLTTVVTAVALLWCLVRRLPAEREGSHSAGTFKGYISLSIPLFFVGLGYLLLGQMDTIMLGHFVTEREVGIYSVAVRLSAFVLLGLEVILPIVGPFWAQFSETKDMVSVENLFSTVTKWMSHAGFVIFIFILVFRVELLRAFGKGFEPGAVAVLILCIGHLANAVSGPTGQLLSMTGRQRLEVINTVALVAVNFLLNLFLIPRFGMSGAASATALSIAAINLIKLLQVRYLFGLQPYSTRYFKGIGAIMSAGLACYLVRMWLFQSGISPYGILVVAGTVFFVTAIGVLWVTGLDEEDKLALLALRRRQVKA